MPSICRYYRLSRVSGRRMESCFENESIGLILTWNRSLGELRRAKENKRCKGMEKAWVQTGHEGLEDHIGIGPITKYTDVTHDRLSPSLSLLPNSAQQHE